MNPLRWILRFAFGCHHRHLSRVFTINKRTYRVCFDCGGEFTLPDAQKSDLKGHAFNRSAAI
jgi:hypothetical protein